MDVLAITPFPVFPATHGGRVRTQRLATGLARAGARVDVLFPWTPGRPLRAFCQDGVTYRSHRLPASVLPALVGDRWVSPLVALSFQPYALGPRRLLERLLRHDVVQFHFCASASWMERLAGRVPRVYVAHNVEVDYLAEQGSSAARAGPAVRRLASLERRAVAASDLVVACSDADAGRLRELYGRATRIEVLPQAAEPGGEPDRAAARDRFGIDDDELAIVFVGGPATHNRAAAALLEREILPRLRRPARLLLAGRCAGPMPPTGDPRVLRLGYVEDLRPAFAAADVAVNPTGHGTGASVKMAEFLAAGLPVVTSAAGMRGFEAYADRMTLAEPDALAAVLESLELTAARTPVEELGVERIGARLLAAYEELTSRTRGRSTTIVPSAP